MLYQPNERELALCTGNHIVFAQARESLENINSFALKPDGNIAITQPGERKATIYTVMNACTCIGFRQAPWVSPRPNGNNVKHCRHTLAWETYKRILRQHYQLQRQYMNPPQPADKWLRGEHHPINLAAYFAFAAWLAEAENGTQSATILDRRSATTARMHELPAGYAALPWGT